MISLKKHIDGWVPRRDELDSGEVPAPKLPGPAAATPVVANPNANGKLPADHWVEQALQRLDAGEREMKETIDVMARAVQSVAERDERYAREVVDVAQRLRSIAAIEDLARIRHAILDSASSLTACVERIAEDGRESLRRLTADVEAYRSLRDKPESAPRDTVIVSAVAHTGGNPIWKPAAEQQWAERASLRLEANRRELKKIVDVIGKAMDSVTGRDERYSSEVGGIAQRLRSIASLKDLAHIRHGVIDNASSLTTCVERIAEDGQESLRRLTTEVQECAQEYHSRRDGPEGLSQSDLLADLTNRRLFEEHLNVRIKAGGRFCLILIALNDLKRVNSQLGRIAGDDLLKQFALELRTQFPAADLVACCGGGEFAVIITTSYRDAEARVRRIRRAALGEYKLKNAEQSVVIGIDAAIGLVEWDGAETSQSLLAHGDASLYSGKFH